MGGAPGAGSVGSDETHTTPEVIMTPSYGRLFPAKVAARLLLLLVLQPQGELAAQSSRPLEPGDEVRITWLIPAAPVNALFPGRETASMEIIRVDESQIVGRARDRLIVVDTRAVTSVRRRIGTKPATSPEMVIGSAAGFGAGFLFGALSHSIEGPRQQKMSAGDRGIAIGIFFGAPLGAFAMWLNSRSRGIYEEVGLSRVRPTVSVAPSGRAGLAVTIGM